MEQVRVTFIKNPFDPIRSQEIRFLPSGFSVKEYVNSFGDWNSEGYDLAISIDGHIVKDIDKDNIIDLRPNQSMVFCAVPQDSGGGKDPLRTIAMIALIIVTAIYAPELAAYLTSTTVASPAAIALTSMGMMTAGSIVINSVLPPPTADLGQIANNGYNSSPTYSWDAKKNNVNEGVALPIVYGKCKVVPPIIGKYIETVGDLQYLNVLYAIADHEVDSINTIRINENPIENYGDAALVSNNDSEGRPIHYSCGNGPEVEIRYGSFTQSVISYFGDTRTDTYVGTKISTSWITQAMTGTIDGFVIGISLPKGLCYIENDGSISAQSVKLDIEFKKQSSPTWIRMKEYNHTVTVVPIGRWSGGYFDSVWGVWVELEAGGTDPSEHFEGATYVHEGTSYSYVSYDYDGNPGATVTPNLIWHFLATSETIYEVGEIETDYVEISLAQTDPVKRVFPQEAITPDEYEVRIRFHEQPVTGLRIANDTYFEFYQTVLYDDFTYPGVTLMALRALATDKLSGGMPTVDCIVERNTLDIQTGANTTVSKPGNNPAWQCYDLLNEQYYGGNTTYSRIVYDKFSTWADYCATKGLTSNIYFDAIVSIRKALDMISVLGRGNVFQMGNLFTCVVDKPEAVPVQGFMFTMGNIVKDSFKREPMIMDERANAIELTYWDETADYQRQILEIRADEFETTTTEINTSQITLVGCTNREMAIKHARYLLNCNRYLTIVHSWLADVDSIGCYPGQIIEVSHDVPQYGYSGRIVSAVGTTVVLDREVTIDAYTNHIISIQHLDTDVREDRNIQWVADTTTTNTLTITAAWDNIPAIYTQYAFGHAGIETLLMRVLKITRDQDQRRKITAIEYNENIYNDSVIVPEYIPTSDLAKVDRLRAEEIWEGGNTSSVNLSWSGISLTWQIYYKEELGSWICTGTTSIPIFKIKNIIYGKNYIFSVTVNNRPDDGEQISLTLTGKNIVPGNVLNATGTQIEDGVLFTWNDVADWDVITYKVRIGIQWEALRSYNSGDFVIATYPHDRIFKCTQMGISGATEPEWPEIPSASPSSSPSISPSASPSLSPSASVSPSISPSLSPSASISPSASPSKSPSTSPSKSPSASPSVSPSASPSESSPSISPSASPSLSPSASVSPSISPSLSPSASISPSASPSKSPSISPSTSPSTSPSKSPSVSPSISPSVSPSVAPTISDGTVLWIDDTENWTWDIVRGTTYKRILTNSEKTSSIGYATIRIYVVAIDQFGNESELAATTTLESGKSVIKAGTMGGFTLSASGFATTDGIVGISSIVTGGIDWRIWAGNAIPASAPFRVDENGNLYATSGAIGGWTLGATTLSSSSITLDSTTPSIKLGAASAFFTGIGIWMGKDVDTVYKLHIGNPDTKYIKWDGTDLTITGAIIAASGDIAGTISNSFIINNDLSDANIDLVLGRTTGGNATLRWNGSTVALDKAFGVWNGSLSLNHTGMAHGMTDFGATTVGLYGSVVNHKAEIVGLSDADNTGLSLIGIIGVTDPTDTTAAVIIHGEKKNGTGGQALGATEIVLKIDTYTTDLVTVLGSGNVGIGTTAPGAKLDIRGDSIIYSTNGPYMEGWSAFYTGSAADGGGLNLHIGAAGTAPGATTLKSYLRVRGTNYNTILGIFGGVVSEQVPIEVVNANGNVLLAQSTGNVGIGMTEPNARLDLGGGFGASGEKFLIYNDDTSSALAGTKIGFYLDRFSLSNNSTFVFPTSEVNPGSFIIASKDTSGTTLVARMTVLGENGNVGIGTTVPRKLTDFLSTSQSQLRLTYTDNAVYSDFTVGSGGNLTIAPTGDFIFDPTGNDILPNTNYDLNLGSLAKKYLTLHAAELWVETLVAQNVMATIGGRILVAPTTLLVADLTDIATTIHVKHNNLANGDRIYLEADSKVEFMSVDSAAGGGAGDYTYTVTRNLDGSGANVWYAGDAVLNTGTTGDGFIDLYSVSGVLAGTGPTIVGNVRTGTTYNNLVECWAIGNLNGLYGYGADTYGAAFGKYSAADYLTIDPTNGIRFFDLDDVVRAQLSAGVWTLGYTTNEHVRISSTAIELKDGATVYATLTGSALSLGDGANEHVLINTSGMAIKDGAVVLALYAASTTFYDTGGADRLILGTTGVFVGDQTEGEYINIDSTNGIRIYGNATLIGQWKADGTSYIGDQANEHIKLSTTGLEIYDGAVLYATYGATTTIGLIASEHISISPTAVQMKNGATVLVDLTNAVLTLGDSANEHVLVDTTGMSVKDGATIHAVFAATTTIGATAGGEYISLASTGIEMYGNNVQRVNIASDGTGWLGTNAGITWDAAGNISISGAMSAGTIDIGGDDATSFHVDTGGGIWSGASIANKATAPFRVSNVGILTAKDIILTGNIITRTADAEFSAQDPTNIGINYLGGWEFFVAGDNQIVTFKMHQHCLLFSISDSYNGKGGLFFAEYKTSTIVKMADPSSFFAVTDSDLNPGYAIYKDANSQWITIKNYTNDTRYVTVNVIGVVVEATAPA